jgi:hypothetical protein
VDSIVSGRIEFTTFLSCNLWAYQERQTQIPKFGKDCFGIGCGGKHFLAQILNFGIWDLGQFCFAAVEMLSCFEGFFFPGSNMGFPPPRETVFN